MAKETIASLRIENRNLKEQVADMVSTLNRLHDQNLLLRRAVLVLIGKDES